MDLHSAATAGGSFLETGGLVAAVVGVLKALEMLINKMAPKLNGNGGGGTIRGLENKLDDHLQHLRGKVDHADEVLRRVDDDGLPLVYYPRRALKQGEDILYELRKIRAALEHLGQGGPS